jgi:hypothetical protein
VSAGSTFGLRDPGARIQYPEEVIRIENAAKQIFLLDSVF